MKRTEFDNLNADFKNRVRKLYIDSLDNVRCLKDADKVNEYKGWVEALEAVFGQENLKPINNWNDLYLLGYARPTVVSVESPLEAFKNNKGALVAIATLRIAQLMPHFGGAVTTADWQDETKDKYVIRRCMFKQDDSQGIVKYFDFEVKNVRDIRHLTMLAFYTERDARRFLFHNEELVAQYLKL